MDNLYFINPICYGSEINFGFHQLWIPFAGGGSFVLEPADSRYAVGEDDFGLIVMVDDIFYGLNNGKELTNIDGLVAEILVEQDFPRLQVNTTKFRFSIFR